MATSRVDLWAIGEVTSGAVGVHDFRDSERTGIGLVLYVGRRATGDLDSVKVEEAITRD